MSILKRLFGGGNSETPGETAAEVTEHEGYSIRPTPQKDGGQFRLCALITKEIDGTVREHRLIRADMFASSEEAANAAMRKAKQVIKEQGDAMFD